MTQPLSQRLEAEAARLEDDGHIIVADLLLEAASLAKRVEEAQTGKVDMRCAIDAVVIDDLDDPGSLVKRRVALVTLEEP